MTPPDGSRTTPAGRSADCNSVVCGPRLAYRAVTVALLAGLALLAGSAPAWAHSKLESSDPADGTSVATPPGSVSLTFNEDVQPGFSVMTIVGPDGRDYHSGPVTETDETIKVGALPLGPAGVYRIGYRVVSADGHPVSGATSFTLTAAGPGSPSAPLAAGPTPSATVPATDTSSGPPVWPWIAGAVVLVGVGAAAALRMGRAPR